MRKFAEMTALFGHPTYDTADAGDRRRTTANLRLRAGLWILYHQATGAGEFDPFVRDAKTWALFEHAVQPELNKFTFFDPRRQAYASSESVLADAMYHIWTVTDLGINADGRPTTIHVIKEVADYLCAVYQTTPVDRRNVKRGLFGANSAN